MTVSVLDVVFRWQFKKNQRFQFFFWNLSAKYSSQYGKVHGKTTRTLPIYPLHFINNAKKLLVFGENDFNFLQNHIFWNFDHISRIYNQTNHRNIWFSKVTIILIMIAQVLFSIFFSKKTSTLNPLRLKIYIYIKNLCKGILWLKINKENSIVFL